MSATIELSQLIFMRGLFEWDDMIHNGLGYGRMSVYEFFEKQSKTLTITLNQDDNVA